MPSPQVYVTDNGGANVDPVASGVGVNVGGGDAIVIQLQNLAADTWSCNLVGQDDQVTAPTFTLDPVGKKVSFTAPVAPFALIFESVVDNGQDINGNAVASYRQRFGIYCLDAAGHRPMAANERGEGSTLFGWVTKLNAIARSLVTATGLAAWQTGTDAAYTLPAATGLQNVVIPALTASRTWKLSNATAGDGMRVKLCDAGYSASTSGHYTQAGIAGFAITLQGFAGTEHIYAEGKDQGTSYVVPASLLGNGSVAFEYRASDTTWSLV